MLKGLIGLVMFITLVYGVGIESQETDVFLVGIAGGSGSGKTYVTTKLKEAFGDSVELLSLDDYYKDLKDSDNVDYSIDNFDHPDAFDFDLFKKDLERLKKGQTIDVPDYDFVTASRFPSKKSVTPSKFVLIEGILLLHNKEIRNLLDFKVFVDTEDDLRFKRRLMRDIKERGRSEESVYTQYNKTVFPMYKQFVKTSAQFADLIISSSDLHEEVFDGITSCYELKHEQSVVHSH